MQVACLQVRLVERVPVLVEVRSAAALALGSVGGEGVTSAVLSSVEDAFNTRELIKVKLQESAPLHVKDAAGELSSGVTGAHSVQTIGKTVVLYRPHPENPEIKLPKAGG